MPDSKMATQCDVLVIGAGAGGLSAAITAAFHGLNVVVVEKAPKTGGATAWSGGWAWVPGNPFAHASGVVEDPEEFRTYLRNCLGEHYESERIDAFIEAAPHMVGFFHGQTSLQFVPGAHINDIYGKVPGAGTGNRSVGAKPFRAREMSRAMRKTMRWQLYETSFLGMGIMAGADIGLFLDASQGNIRGIGHAVWRVGFYILDLITHGRGMHLVNGAALAARLLKSADDLGIDVRVSTAARELTINSTGRVTGAIVRSPDGELTISASRGVVLATGGFPNDLTRRDELFPPKPTGREHWTLVPSESAGDGASMAQSVGALFRTDLASPAAWCPVSLVPYRSGRVGVFPHIMDRAKPGSIGVLKNGRRFVNEANGYHDYVAAMFAATPEGGTAESWQVADSRFVRRYPLGMVKPLPIPLFPYLRSGYLKKGRSIEELARECGIDPTALRATIDQFNSDARNGVDSHFERGETPFNRYGGDRRVTPNPSLAPIEKGPFYAVRVVPGSFGTFDGIAVDGRARALNATNVPIEGLYVAGSDQANVMGGTYPAGGINLAPALTFGYVAGRELAGVTEWEDAGWDARHFAGP